MRGFQYCTGYIYSAKYLPFLSDDNKSRTNSSCPVLKLSFISWFLWFPWSHLYFEERKKIIVSTPLSLILTTNITESPTSSSLCPFRVPSAQIGPFYGTRQPRKLLGCLHMRREPGRYSWYVRTLGCKRWSFSWKTGVRFIFYLPLYYPHMDRYTRNEDTGICFKFK